MGNQRIKRITAFFLACMVAFLFGACRQGENQSDNGAGNGTGNISTTGGSGAAGTTQDTGGRTEDSQSASPLFYELPRDEEADSVIYTSVSFEGDRMYYIYTAYQAEAKRSEWCYVDIADSLTEPVAVLDLTEYETRGEEEETDVMGACPCEDGGTVLLLRTQPVLLEDAQEEAYARRQRETRYRLKKLAADGTIVFDMEVTAYLQTAVYSTAGIFDLQIFADKENAVYVSDKASCVWVFDKEGNHRTSIGLQKVQGFAAAVHMLPDGRLGVLYQGGGIQGNGMQMAFYNPNTGQLMENHTNLPQGCRDFSPAAGADGGILLSGGVLYEYNCKTKECKELVKWSDYGINADTVRQAAALTEGRLAVYCSDYREGTDSLLLFLGQDIQSGENTTRPAKEVLTLGAMYVSPFLRAAVVQFNRTNEHYRIEIKSYGSTGNASAENGEDARMRFYSDIMTGNAPDMFLAGEVDMSLFAMKGLIADLSPYLEDGAAVERADLFDTVLSAYTVGDTLCAIPVSFCIRTIAGRTAEVGGESGWTLEEMIAFAEAHPKTPILPCATKKEILDVCLLFDFDRWVDWEAGECFFDTPEFKEVMAFANRYPAGEEASNGRKMEEIMEHRALLHRFHIQLLQDWQMETLLFQELITVIGYPSSDRGGVFVVGYDDVCISASSPNKEAAWSFIETLLSKELQKSKELPHGIPIRADVFEEKLAEEMEPHYKLDANGEVLLDENGKPKEESHVGVFVGDMEFWLYAVTQEEADGIRQVISRIDGMYDENNILMEIILEEIEPYFAGQKSVDEAADIIQNRVQLYLNESR